MRKIFRILLLLAIPATAAWVWYTYYHLPRQQHLIRIENQRAQVETLVRKARPCVEEKKARDEDCVTLRAKLASSLDALHKDQMELDKEEQPDLFRSLDRTLIAGHSILAESARKAGDFTRALASYAVLRRLDPQNGLWYARSALLLSRQKKHRQAAALARLATQLAPDTWQAFRDYSLVLEHAHRLKEALQAMRRAVALAPFEESKKLEAQARRLSAMIEEN